MAKHLLFCSDLARRDLSGQRIKRLEGWCIASSPVLALYFHHPDIQYEQVPLGFPRSDVCDTYPDYPRAA